MPEYFQGLKEHRGSNAATRQYTESAWSQHKSTEPVKSHFSWSNSLLKDIRNLDFGGGDHAIQWELRGRGLSYYALGPIDNFASGKYVQATDDWKLFEQADLDGTLTLEERRLNFKNGELLCSTPTNRTGTVSHLYGVADRKDFLCSKGCPVIGYLRWYGQKISSDATFALWTEEDWLAFNWEVHRGVRKVWTDCDNGINKVQLAYLRRIKEDLDAGRKFSLANCPPQLRARKRDAGKAAGGGGGGGSGGGGDADAAGKNKKPKARGDPQSSPLADNFSVIYKNAKEAAKVKRNFWVGTILPKKTDFDYVMGSDFPEHVEGARPCGRFFLHECRTPNCPFSHKLKSAPERSVLEEMVKRFKERADKYVAEQASKE